MVYSVRKGSLILRELFCFLKLNIFFQFSIICYICHMIDMYKEYKDLRVSLEENSRALSIFVYRHERLLVSVDINPLDVKKTLQAVLQPLVAEERYEESVVLRDLIKELEC